MTSQGEPWPKDIVEPRFITEYILGLCEGRNAHFKNTLVPLCPQVVVINAGTLMQQTANSQFERNTEERR